MQIQHELSQIFRDVLRKLILSYLKAFRQFYDQLVYLLYRKAAGDPYQSASRFMSDSHALAHLHEVRKMRGKIECLLFQPVAQRMLQQEFHVYDLHDPRCPDLEIFTEYTRYRIAESAVLLQGLYLIVVNAGSPVFAYIFEHLVDEVRYAYVLCSILGVPYYLPDAVLYRCRPESAGNVFGDSQ